MMISWMKKKLSDYDNKTWILQLKATGVWSEKELDYEEAGIRNCQPDF